MRKIAQHCGFTPTAEQWPKILEYTSFPWMKAHGVAFEAATLAPVPVMKPGTMIRKGAVGKASEDGMSPEIAAIIRAHMEKYVADPVAVKWAYEGGAVPADDAAALVATSSLAPVSTTTTITHPNGTTISVTTTSA
eukprot:SAG31_NODE_18697_length_626_cov_1.074004_2_plen_136_part_00